MFHYCFQDFLPSADTSSLTGSVIQNISGTNQYSQPFFNKPLMVFWAEIPRDFNHATERTSSYRWQGHMATRSTEIEDTFWFKRCQNKRGETVLRIDKNMVILTLWLFWVIVSFFEWNVIFSSSTIWARLMEWVAIPLL